MTTHPPSHRWIASLVLGLAFALLATSCSSGDAEPEAGSDVADSVIATVDAIVGASDAGDAADTIPEGCHIEQTEDEYGFAVDVVVCDGEEPPPDRGPDVRFVDWAGGDDADHLAVLVRNALVLDGGCADGDLIRELETAAGSAPAEVREPLEVLASELAQAAPFCKSDAVQWEAHLRLAIGALEEFVRVADAARVQAVQEAADG